MVFRALAALLLALAMAIAPGARGADIALVLGDSGGAYGEFASSFQQFTEGSPWRVRWTGSADNLEGAPRVDLIVAVGSEATRAVLRRGGSTPIVAALMPRHAYERALADTGPRPKGGITALYLDQPLSRLLAFTRFLLPERRRVGLLAGPETRALLPLVRQSATSQGLAVEMEDGDLENSPVPAMNRLFPRIDVLLALPDSAVYRRDNIRAILLTSYRFQRPVIAFSQALVTAGALAAIYTTPAQAARQTADLVRGLHPESISLPPPQVPNLFAIAVNNNVAQALGLALPDESAIRRALTAEKDAR